MVSYSKARVAELNTQHPQRVHAVPAQVIQGKPPNALCGVVPTTPVVGWSWEAGPTYGNARWHYTDEDVNCRTCLKGLK